MDPTLPNGRGPQVVLAARAAHRRRGWIGCQTMSTSSLPLSTVDGVELRAGMESPPPPLMLIMDVDSTLIDQEVIDLLAVHAGREAEVAEVTERAMRGELDFSASLHARLQALAGLPEGALAEVLDQVTPTRGAEQLISAFRCRGWPVYAVSGGFTQILSPLAQQMGLTDFRANELEIADGVLTGRVNGPVVDRAAKARHLQRWAAEQDIPLASVVAVGDGANDLEMVQAAGVGVAFCAKPALAQAADLVVTRRDLSLLADALGLTVADS
ncbi:phosphoserine phosphatase SerB [Nesterenkonia populi]|uniref:phosphoserine phosphatase SerB n=1 Tax=Nesterenkonia populi TaxID=1591087 RepID=UPI0011BF52BC|nr:phosphoserine phosphatase SerB [Nesterenkonia populi]